MPETAFTKDERARIKAFVESGNPDDLTTDEINVQGSAGSRGSISAEMCREWRERIRDGGEDGTDVTHSEPWSNTAMRNHIYGRCSHPESRVGEPPESPGPRGEW